ncbi:MAG: MBL fold metallo-hydrolase [Deltaproteobacteria bacterium]
MEQNITEVDRVEILTLQDNYIDIVRQDNNEVIQRAIPVKDGEIKNSVLAEHGFSSLVTVSKGDNRRSIIFDFGFSADGAARNVEALQADLGSVEAAVLSHGHMDHTGGMAALLKMTDKKGIPLVAHPEVFRAGRYKKVGPGLNVAFPPFTWEMVEKTGATLIETDKPYPLVDGTLLFLGAIPRLTDFEKGAAISVTGVEEVFAVMGGFHLGGQDMAEVVEPTVKALKEIDPRYVIPTHCTGREAVMEIERQMPNQFLLNMSGTRLTFSA